MIDRDIYGLSGIRLLVRCFGYFEYCGKEAFIIDSGGTYVNYDRGNRRSFIWVGEDIFYDEARGYIGTGHSIDLGYSVLRGREHNVKGEDIKRVNGWVLVKLSEAGEMSYGTNCMISGIKSSVKEVVEGLLRGW